MKRCKSCGEALDTSEFNKNRLYKDGLRADCRACQKSYNKEHRQVCREHYKTFDKERSTTPDRVKELAVARDLHRERYPAKYKARCAVSNAIRDGRLTRPDKCSVCCKECVPDGHHHSYEEEFWLDVTWVCRGCHTKLHTMRNKPMVTLMQRTKENFEKALTLTYIAAMADKQAKADKLWQEYVEGLYAN